MQVCLNGLIMSELPITLNTNEGIKIVLKEGCITKEKADVIINSTRDDLDLDSGALSRSIYHAAGPQIQIECKEKSPDGIKRGQVCDTSAGKLPSKTIYHGALSPWMSGAGEKDLLAFIRCFLDKADIEGKTSMVIPAITTGNLHFPHKVVAKVIHEEICKFSKANPNTTLKDIRIIVYDQTSVQEFTSFFSSLDSKTATPSPRAEPARETPSPRVRSTRTPRKETVRTQGSGAAQQRPSSGWLSSLFRTLSTNETPQETQGAQAQSPVVVTFQTNEQIEVRVKRGNVSESQTDVVVNITTKDLRLNHGAITSSILKAAGSTIEKECKTKAPNGLEYGEMVETSGGRMKCKAIYHGTVRGWSSGKGEEDLKKLMATTLESASDDDMESITFPSIGTGIILGYPAAKVAKYMIDAVEEFSSSTSDTSIETIDIVLYEKDRNTIKAFQSYVESKYNVRGQSPVTQPSEALKPVIPLPDKWSAMGDKELYKLENLNKTSTEFQEVAKQFKDKGGPNKIQKIQRVQCPNMYQLFMVRRAQMDTTITDKVKYPVERTLYHGTAKASLDGINLLGFNRSFSGQNATVLGYGSYFAQEASYSANDTYSPVDAEGNKHIYQCRVLTGEFTAGKNDMKIPPMKDPSNPNVLYDTVTDNVNQPRIFVVFYDAQAYPEYLITFKQ